MKKYLNTGVTTCVQGILFISLLCFIGACNKATDIEDKPPLRLVKTQKVTAKSIRNWQEFPGVVEAAQQAELAFRVPGKLNSILVEEGDDVSENQLLATLDDTDYKIQLSSREAEYGKAKADIERAKSLIKQNLIARADYDKLLAQYAGAKASFEAAKQNVAYTFLNAPFDGVIARKRVENFEDVSAIQPIFSLQEQASLHIKVDIPETFMIHVVKDNAPKAYASFAELPGQQFPLSLQATSTEADPESRTFEVTFKMENKGSANILPGMSVTVGGNKSDDALSLIVPHQAVIENNEGRFVYIVQANGDNTGTVLRRQVVTGEVFEQGILILSGLVEGDDLIIAGMSKMSDGMLVRVKMENKS